FVWDGVYLIEQTRNTQTITWEYLPGGFTPIGQIDQEEVDRRFYAVVTDLTGAPNELIALNGRVVWQQRTTIWGALTQFQINGTDCPLRFPGQYQDYETGTCYNYHRYYDPTTARYQTNDPLGLAPAPNPHAYVSNPLDTVDPLGLAPYTNLSKGATEVF